MLAVYATQFPTDAVQSDSVDYRSPSTPFAATQERAKQNWKDDFLSGLQSGLGVQVIPISDAQTPNFNAASGGGSVPGVASVLSQPIVAWGLVALIGFLIYKKVR